MPQTNPPDSFLLLIIDEDLKVFNLAGPMNDDTETHLRASKARGTGRGIRIERLPHMTLTLDEIIAETRNRLNCEYAEVSVM